MAGAPHVDAAAELGRRAEAHDAHLVAVFLAKQGDGAQFLGFLDWGVAMLVKWQVGPNHAVDDALHLAQLFVTDFLEIVEVEAQRLVVNVGSALLGLLAQDLLQGIVEQVGGGVVAG